MDKKSQLQKLLAVVSPTQAAAAVGVEVSYVSQLMLDTEFAMAVARQRCANLLADTERDSKYNALEDKLLAKLEDILPVINKPREVLQALMQINGAKRRGSTEAERQQAQPVTNVLVLNLPTAIKTKFTLNSQNEVVSVGDRPLKTIDGDTLIKEINNAKSNVRALESAAA